MPTPTDTTDWTVDIAQHRAHVGLSAMDYATLVGVNRSTLRAWERDGVTPGRAHQVVLRSVFTMSPDAAKVALHGGGVVAAQAPAADLMVSTPDGSFVVQIADVKGAVDAEDIEATLTHLLRTHLPAWRVWVTAPSPGQALEAELVEAAAETRATRNGNRPRRQPQRQAQGNGAA